MALLSLRTVSLAFGGPRLFDGIDMQIERGERVCLLGRNGEGKSSLLRLIEGQLEPDDGEVIREQGLQVARLPQEVAKGQGDRSPARLPRGCGRTDPTPEQTIASTRSSRAWGWIPRSRSTTSPRE